MLALSTALNWLIGIAAVGLALYIILAVILVVFVGNTVRKEFKKDW